MVQVRHHSPFCVRLQKDQALINYSVIMLMCAGFVGGWLGHLSKVPSGPLLGALLAVILLKLAGPPTQPLPWSFKFVGQVMIGILIGAGFHREMLPQLQKLWLPVFVSALLLIGVGVVTAIIMAKFKVLDLTTLYLSTSPGGMTALVTIAVDEGAAAPVVVLFHFTRLLLVVFSAPMVIQLLKVFL